MKNDQYLRILRILRNFTGPEQISVKSRELSFEHLWIYYILSNDKENFRTHSQGW